MYIWHTQRIYFIIYFLLKKLNLNKYKYQFMMFNVIYCLLLSAIFKKIIKNYILIKSDHLNKTHLDLKICRYSNSGILYKMQLL